MSFWLDCDGKNSNLPKFENPDWIPKFYVNPDTGFENSDFYTNPNFGF